MSPRTVTLMDKLLLTDIVAKPELLRTRPVQARSLRQLQTIVTAARHVLREVGRDELTTAMVADRAGVSIGTFYRYYDDRGPLLDEILTITTVDQVRALPRGSVLLCAVNEVFWLAPGEGKRTWYAAGYTADSTWTDETVLDWVPLRLLHRGDR